MPNEGRGILSPRTSIAARLIFLQTIANTHPRIPLNRGESQCDGDKTGTVEVVRDRS
jgi:hypothetical protein